MKKVILAILLLLILLGGIGVWNWIQPVQKNKLLNGEPVIISKNLPSITPIQYRVESFIENLSVPWSMVFTSPTRILVTERSGKVRVIENGKLLPTPIQTFAVSNQSEEGLMGMTLDPKYDENKYVYICLAYGTTSPIYDKVIRVTDTENSFTDETIILDKIPAAQFHAGCRLRFGPGGKLYITTGDAREKEKAQDTNSLAGKILRINPDGSIPSDNPFSNSAVFSYGHRNPQGLDWNPISKTLVATEHGPSGNDGPGGGDEINVIKSGKNYGWPVVSHDNSREGMVSPLVQWTPAIAPASGMFYKGTVFPQFTNTFLFGMLRGEGITQVVFEKDNPEKIAQYVKLPGISVGRVRDVVEGPDGFIYFTTSNRDGRGKTQVGDDKIYRLIPEQKQ